MKYKALPYGVRLLSRHEQKPVIKHEEPQQARDGHSWLRVDHVKRTTDRAVLYRMPDGRDQWVPLSQIKSRTVTTSGLFVEIPTWLKNKRVLTISSNN